MEFRCASRCSLSNHANAPTTTFTSLRWRWTRCWRSVWGQGRWCRLFCTLHRKMGKLICTCIFLLMKMVIEMNKRIYWHLNNSGISCEPWENHELQLSWVLFIVSSTVSFSSHESRYNKPVDFSPTRNFSHSHIHIEERQRRAEHISTQLPENITRVSHASLLHSLGFDCASYSKVFRPKEK